MDRRQLEYFLAVIDYGSMSRAADHLRVSQPSVSQAIRSLERQLGSNLFERRSGQLVITQTGRALIGPARQVIREFLTAERTVAQLVNVSSGRLDLAIPQILALYPTAELIGEFATQYPDVRIRLEDQTKVNAVWEAVKTGRCELGFVTTLDDTNLKAHLLGRQHLVAVFPPGSPNEGVPVSIEELVRVKWVAGPPLGFSTRLTLERELTSRGLSMPTHIQTAHRQTIPRLILSGVAAALLIAEEAEDMRAFGAVLRPTEPVIDRPYYLVHRRERLSAAAQAFLEMAIHQCSVRRTATARPVSPSATGDVRSAPGATVAPLQRRPFSVAGGPSARRLGGDTAGRH